MNVHPTAVVDPTARIGEGCSIGPYAVIEADVTLGSHSSLGPHVVIHRFTEVGERCTIHTGAVLGGIPQDLGFKDVESYVRIGSDCTIREGVTIHRGSKEGTSTIIGDHGFLMANCHVGHNVVVAERVILANGVLLAGHVEVGARTFVGGGAGVHQFVRIGRLSMIGGLCGLTKDVPPFCLVAGVSLNGIAGLNSVGMRRAGMTPEERSALKEAFRVLFRSGLNVPQATQRLRESFHSDLVEELCTFVEQSKRGICRYRGRTQGHGVVPEAPPIQTSFWRSSPSAPRTEASEASRT